MEHENFEGQWLCRKHHNREKYGWLWTLLALLTLPAFIAVGLIIAQYN